MGVFVGVGVKVNVGVKLGGMMTGVFVIAKKGVGDSVAVKEAVGDSEGTTVERFTFVVAKHPPNGNAKLSNMVTNKIRRL